MQPEQWYLQRKEELTSQLNTLQRKKTSLGWGRFAGMLAIIAAIYFTIQNGPIYILLVVVLAAVFVRLVYADINNNNHINHLHLLLQVNDDELTFLRGNYYHFDNGEHYQPHSHHYANDLDLFGHASLFQYINRTASEMGNAALASWFLAPATEPVILERQTAAKELATKNEWRQQLQAFGKEKRIGLDTKARLQAWINEPASFQHPAWRALQLVAPLTMIIIIGLNIADLVSNPVRNYFLLGSALVAWFISKKVIPVHAQVSKMADELAVLSNSIGLIEKTNFTTPLLQRLHGTYTIKNGFASGELKQLKSILGRLDYRLNPVIFIPLALLVQWDLQQVRALERWKKRNQQNIHAWFDSLGDLETLNSLAILHFNHPEWCFPTLAKLHFSIKGTAIGHPLINSAKRVSNPISIAKSGELMLITGSNMAGKSTYLRSIGINVVLTMMGAPVCAKTFSLSPVQLITSMRIADNLEENTSTFYAELKKLKTVIEMVNNREQVFILLDEILRGTNSLDRHTGSVALTKQLIKNNAAGIIATHDVELAKLKENYPQQLLNYHFDAQVSNDELYFDYELKEGICSSINASLLMRKIGIEL